MLPALDAGWVGEVTGVPDCDRLVVSRAGAEVQVRLLGADCPEPGQEFFKISKRFTTLEAHSQRVSIEDELAGPGLLTARVKLQNGADLGAELVRNGMAWYDRSGDPADSQYAALEQSARDHWLGLWSEESPEAPWDFKARSEAGARAEVLPEKPAPPVSAAAPEGPASLEIVFHSPSGGRFHRSGCPSLGEAIPGTVSEALEAGLAPCPRCFPPRVGMSEPR